MFNIESKKNLATTIFILMLVLCFISIINQFSISSAESLKMNHNYYSMIIKHVAFIGISIVFSLVFFKVVSVETLYNYSEVIYFIGLGLIILLYSPLARTVNGARRWIPLKVVTIQPSEFAKIFLIIIIAYIFQNTYYAKKKDKLKIYLLLCVICAIYAGLILGTKSFSATVQICLIAFFMICFNPKIPYKYIILSIFASFPFIYFAITSAPYRTARFSNFEHGMYSIKSISNGGLFGVGYGNSFARNFYLPEVQTDYVFAGFSEEWGFIASLVLILIYVLLSILLFKSVNFGNTIFEKMCIIGIALMFTNQFILHILINVSLLPSTGVTLPFMSSGGSSILVSTFSIILVITIISNSKVQEER